MPPVLTFHEVSKRFRKPPGSPALAHLTMTVEPGEIVGFLGPNGAGKTTALHLALGFLRPTSGSGEVFGKPFGDASARRSVGFVSDQPVFFPGDAETAVAIAATFSGIRPSRTAIRESLELAGIDDARGDVRKYSRGMQQRLSLAQALVHKPRLLLLDEPISALDPRSSIAVLDLLSRLRDQGTAVLLSSHQLEAVATIADRLVLLDQGRLLLEGRTRDLLQASSLHSQDELTFDALPPGAFLAATLVARDGPRATYRCANADQQRVIQQAWALGGTLVALQSATETLTDLFLRMTSAAASPQLWSEDNKRPVA